MTTPRDDETTGVVLHNVSKRSMLRNVAYGYLATFTSLIAGFLVTPILYRKLDSDGFGAFALVVSIAGFALFTDLGVGTSTIRRVSAALAVGDDESLMRAIVSSRRLMRASAVVSLVFLSVLAWQLPSFVDLPEELRRTAQWSLASLAVGQSILVAWSTSTSVVVAHGRSDLFAKRSLVLGLATAAGQCVVALAGGGVFGVVLVVAVSNVVNAVIGVRIQQRVLGRLVPGAAPGPGEMRDLVREGLANFAISVCGMVSFGSDVIVLGAFAPFAAVSVYAVAARLPNLVRTLSTKATDLLAPTYSHVSTADDDESRRALFAILTRSTKFSLALAITGGILVCVSVRLFLDVWIGEASRATEVVVWLLMASTLLQMVGHSIFVLLTGLRRLRRLLVYSACSALVNLALSVLLTTQLDAAGPALASLICVGVGDLLVLPSLAAAVLGVPARRVIRDLIIVPVLPVLPAVGLAAAGGVPTSSVWSLAVGAVAAGLYVAGFVLLLGRSERAWAGRQLGSVKARLVPRVRARSRPSVDGPR